MKEFLCSLLLILILIGGCSREKEADQAEEKHLSTLVKISPKAIKNAGIQIITVQEKSAGAELTTIAEVRADENKVFHINPPIAGRIIQESVLLGDHIKQGQTVAVLQNLEVAKVNAEFIHQLHQNEIEIHQAKIKLGFAQKNLEREKRLLAEGITSKKDYIQAETDYELAIATFEGLKEHTIHIKSEAKALLNAYGTHLGNIHSERVNTNSALISPRSGIITKKNVVIGDMVNPEETLYEVADLNYVWLDITLYPKDIKLVKLGQKVTFMSDAVPGKLYTGIVNYLQPGVLETSQTFIARTFLKNSNLSLKPGLLGSANIQIEPQEPHIFIPKAAIQSYGKEKFVFLVTKDGSFQKQTVSLKEKVSDGYLVESGVYVGDKIVGKGSFTLKAEMLKSQFIEED